MRRNVWLVRSLAIAAWVVSALPVVAQEAAKRVQAPTKKAAAAPLPPIDPDGKRMEQLLGLWAKQSTRLKSLDVDIEQVKENKAWGKTTYKGRAQFKSPNLASIFFQKEEEQNGVKKYVPDERIVCTGKDVWHYKWDTQQVSIYDLGKEVRQRALQEGPLPFLFNFRADEAKKRYRMSLVREDEKSYVINVFPLEDLDKECFSQALIGLDKKLFLPNAIALMEADGKSVKKYRILKIGPNAAVNDENFKGKRPPQGWTVHYNPKENPSGVKPQPAQPAVGKGAPRRPLR